MSRIYRVGKMANAVPVNIQSSLAICNSLASLVQKSFGPNALLVMYPTSTGKVLLTSEGSAILRALNISHPIGRWLIGRILAFGHQTGDHTKSFLLLVRDILDGIFHELSSVVKVTDLNCDVIVREQIIRLIRALIFLRREIFPRDVLPNLVEKSVCISSMDLKAINKAGENLIHTYLNGRLSLKQANFMSKLLWKFISEYGGRSITSISALKKTALELHDCFHTTCIEAVGRSIESSNVKDGIVLSRSFVKNLKNWGNDCERGKNFVIFGFDPSQTAPESNATISARSEQDLVHNMQHTRLQLVKIVDLLKENNVCLVLCSECLPASVLSLLEQADIIVIQTVPLEELERLSRVANVDILYEIPGELDTTCVGLVKEVREVTLGSRRYSQIVMRDGPGVGHLVLCAPSEGMCRVLSQAALGAIRCVSLWLSEHLEDSGDTSAGTAGSESIVKHSEIRRTHLGQRETPKLESSSSVPHAYLTGSCNETGCLISGGGAAEFIARNALLQLLPKYKDDHYKQAAINIVSNALLCIPRTIYQNSFSSQSKDAHSFFQIINCIQTRHKSEGCKAWGIDGKTGEACCTFDKGILDVSAGKYLLWCSVIDTVVELLNMDAIIPVHRTLKMDENDEKDDD